jgi:hypothetical protein
LLLRNLECVKTIHAKVLAKGILRNGVDMQSAFAFRDIPHLDFGHDVEHLILVRGEEQHYNQGE